MENANRKQKEEITYDYHKQRSFAGKKPELFKLIDEEAGKKYGEFIRYKTKNNGKGKEDCMLFAAKNFLFPSMKELGVAGTLDTITSEAWKIYLDVIFGESKNKASYKKAKIFALRLEKTSPEIFRTWDYQTAKLFKS